MMARPSLLNTRIHRQEGLISKKERLRGGRRNGVGERAKKGCFLFIFITVVSRDR